MLANITLSTGRVVVHTRQPNGSTLATPTPGYYAFTHDEYDEYDRIVEDMKQGEMK